MKRTEGRQLAALAQRYGLGAAATARMEVLAELLARDPTAPISAASRHRVIEDHLADSLVALELDVVRSAGRIVDLGSGAGLPALPLALALPQAEVVALDGSSRKVAFIVRAVEACRLANASALAIRAEEYDAGREGFDLVTARALAPLEVVAEYAAPLLAVGGTLVAWRGRRDPVSEAAALAAAPELGLELGEARSVHPYPGADHRHLHRLTKVAPTPDRFPRRPGMARKRPLGARSS